MRLTHDYRHRFTALYGLEGSCRVRVFEPEDPETEGAGALVIMSDEPGSIPSLRYNVEVVAAEVLLRFALPSSQTAFVEHHPRGWCSRRGDLCPETFELVTFEEHEPGRREISPGRVLAALSGPERRGLRAEVLGEFLVAALLADIERSAGGAAGGGAR